MQKSIYWSLHDHGDGSASPTFYETERLADWDQENLERGWGESCTGTITVQGTGVEFISPTVVTEYGYLVAMLCSYNLDLKKIKKFIDDILPEGKFDFVVTPVAGKYEIYVNGKFAHSKYGSPGANEAGAIDVAAKLAEVLQDACGNNSCLLTKGALVIPTPESGYELVSGCNRYLFAVVAHPNPLILISEHGDMMWKETIKPEYFRVIGRATDKVMAAVEKRLQSACAAGKV